MQESVRVACRLSRSAFSSECVVTIAQYNEDDYIRFVPLHYVTNDAGEDVTPESLPNQGDIAGYVRCVLQGHDDVSATVRAPSEQCTEYITVRVDKVERKQILPPAYRLLVVAA